MELFALKPDQKSQEFADMVHFLAHVSKSYKEIIQPFSQNVYELLDKHVDVLHPQLRMQLLQALMHMRHQGLIEAEALLALCFRLFQCHDKALKTALHSFIVQDIKLANSKGRNDRLNKRVQNYMYRIIEVRSISGLIAMLYMLMTCM
jgi:protein SDA1